MGPGFCFRRRTDKVEPASLWSDVNEMKCEVGGVTVRGTIQRMVPEVETDPSSSKRKKNAGPDR